MLVADLLRKTKLKNIQGMFNTTTDCTRCWCSWLVLIVTALFFVYLEEDTLNEGEDSEAVEHNRVAECAKRVQEKKRLRGGADKKQTQPIQAQLPARTEFSKLVLAPISVVTNIGVFDQFERGIGDCLCSSSSSTTNGTINGCFVSADGNGFTTFVTCGSYSLGYKEASSMESTPRIRLCRKGQWIMTLMDFQRTDSGSRIEFSRYGNQLPDQLHRTMFGCMFQIFSYLLCKSFPELQEVQLRDSLSSDEERSMKLQKIERKAFMYACYRKDL